MRLSSFLATPLLIHTKLVSDYLHDITSITLRTIKIARQVYTIQHDLVYYQQEIKGDQFLNLSIDSRQPQWGINHRYQTVIVFPLGLVLKSPKAPQSNNFH